LAVSDRAVASDEAEKDRPGDASPGTEALPEVADRTVSEGETRLTRAWSRLVATGAVGGIDISVGIFAVYAIRKASGSEALSALGLSMGFIALSLAGSELFTENFLVPIAAIAARRAPARSLFRLWSVSLVTNLAGGWVMTGLIIGAFPKLRPVALELADHYARQTVGWTSFAGALLGGAVITLMTWMEHGTESVGARLVAAVVTGYLLAIGPLNHAVVVSLEMFAGLHAGAPYGYLDWMRTLGWATLGNIVGGIGLVTVLRLVQIGRQVLDEQAQRPSGG